MTRVIIGVILWDKSESLLAAVVVIVVVLKNMVRKGELRRL